MASSANKGTTKRKKSTYVGGLSQKIISQVMRAMGKKAHAIQMNDPEKREKLLAAAAEGRRKKIPPKKRSAMAGYAGSCISPEKAHERALKAWETKRKNASKY